MDAGEIMMETYSVVSWLCGHWSSRGRFKPGHPTHIDSKVGRQSEQSEGEAPRAGLLYLPILRPFDSVPHVMLTLSHNIISLLPHNCNLATVMNRNVNIGCAGYLICDPAPAKGIATHRLSENHYPRR